MVYGIRLYKSSRGPVYLGKPDKGVYAEESGKQPYSWTMNREHAELFSSVEKATAKALEMGLFSWSVVGIPGMNIDPTNGSGGSPVAQRIAA